MEKRLEKIMEKRLEKTVENFSWKTSASFQGESGGRIPGAILQRNDQRKPWRNCPPDARRAGRRRYRSSRQGTRRGKLWCGFRHAGRRNRWSDFRRHAPSTSGEPVAGIGTNPRRGSR